jgi:hypothetical protein
MITYINLKYNNNFYINDYIDFFISKTRHKDVKTCDEMHWNFSLLWMDK